MVVTHENVGRYFAFEANVGVTLYDAAAQLFFHFSGTQFLLNTRWDTKESPVTHHCTEQCHTFDILIARPLFISHCILSLMYVSVNVSAQ
jgi:hypothetical protein